MKGGQRRPLLSLLFSSNQIEVEHVLKSVTYVIAGLAYLSVCRYIGLGYSGLFIALIVLSVYLEYGKGYFVPRWVVNTLSVAVLVLSFYRVYTEDLLEPTVEALAILLGVKFLEEKKFRDYMQIYMISVFMLTGSALLSIDFIFMVFFTLIFFLVATAIVLLTYHTESPSLRLDKDSLYKIIGRSMLIPLVSVPLTVLIFLILPRTNFHFLGFLGRASVGRGGFADNVLLGDVSNIQLDSSVIFRAQMIEPVSNDQLYWRGIVFDHFDGVAWKFEDQETVWTLNNMPIQGKMVRQTIYLEPYGSRYLFTLDKPIIVYYRNVTLYKGFVVMARQDIKSRLRYDAVSILPVRDYSVKDDETRFLQLPNDLSPDIIALAKTITAGMGKKQSMEALVGYLRDGQYKYSLEKLPQSSTPLVDFLFKQKYGNCEYFASALAVMLRASGISANVVGGYKGGVYNSVGGYYIVLQKNAHVWVEAYLKDTGWVRLDATPAAPQEMAADDRKMFPKARLIFDSINYIWNSLVINYNLDKQLSLFQKVHDSIRLKGVDLSFRRFKPAVVVVVIVAVIFILFKLYRLVLNRRPVEVRLIARFTAVLKGYGYERLSSQGLEEFVLTIQEDGLRSAAGAFVLDFERIYYKDKPFTRDDIKHLNAQLSQIRRERKEKENKKGGGAAPPSTPPARGPVPLTPL
ncbi:MAG: DUF3488 domain-containing transglutaminase family protein [Nitrospirae bacterium]|nr:DUF3488 domain-containing transglutaminase family protein [Nitrospirota bacterium]